jgi:hypothetical protein
MGSSIQKRSGMKQYDALPIFDKLRTKIYSYYQTIWRDKWKDGADQAEEWLKNFSDGPSELVELERLNMLYLLSRFMYFGHVELRELLLTLYRDLVRHPIVYAIRKANDDTLDTAFINSELIKELDATRFLGVGNPSESGVHLLYYFRQECKLSKELFINSGDIFKTKQITEKTEGKISRTYLESEIKNKTIKRYIFIDDFCGSGSQAKDYLQETIRNMKFMNPDIEVNYLMLFATEKGLNVVESLKVFNHVGSVFTIDESFKSFSKESRYYSIECTPEINKAFAKDTALKYGRSLYNPPLGYDDCQLLLGLFHNTPDNTLPIFWSEQGNWNPIFKRYHKIY